MTASKFNSAKRKQSHVNREERKTSLGDTNRTLAWRSDRSGAAASAGSAATHLCQLLGFVVERIHYFAHVLNSLEGGFVRFVYGGFVEDDQDSLALVKDACGDREREVRGLAR